MTRAEGGWGGRGASDQQQGSGRCPAITRGGARPGARMESVGCGWIRFVDLFHFPRACFPHAVCMGVVCSAVGWG